MTFFLENAIIFVIVVQYPSQFCSVESGPKNPQNGTSMKFLVSELRTPSLGRMLGVKVVGAISNGMDYVTLLPWRPVTVDIVAHWGISVYGTGGNLYCG